MTYPSDAGHVAEKIAKAIEGEDVVTVSEAMLVFLLGAAFGSALTQEQSKRLAIILLRAAAQLAYDTGLSPEDMKEAASNLDNYGDKHASTDA